ncbi:Folate-biopterin transporter [Parasponia andersonii]|uniref:Folate-biopterin transporter n=1 Tax=Parasponia andersonii TaxID=3476 RepID=A0A2P5D4X1_PARAD|nr:Folate-biopterin transporter [Parasponia andersonii]
MDSNETSALLEKPSDVLFEPPPATTTTTIRIVKIVVEPFQWLQMLSSQLSPTFVFGVILVYGFIQGFSWSFFKVVSDYYWKDVQKVQPSVVQLYASLYSVPWVMKPVWGLTTDVFPVKGYHRRPYFVLAGVIGVVSAAMVAFGGRLAAAVALGCFVGFSAAVAIAEVMIDACIARNSIQFRSLASHLQSLCWFCSSAGALIGYSASGFFVHHLGPQVSFGLLVAPTALLVLLGFVIYEPKTTSGRSETKITDKLGLAIGGVYKTIKFPEVWKPSLYMYLALALNVSTYEGQFYWYTNPNAGPAFSKEFVGIFNAIGAMSSLLGVLIYHKTLKDYPFRTILFLVQLLYSVSGILDLIFILRWNMALGIPDYFFVVMDECVTWTITRMRWLPMIVLSTRLCPLGIEGSFFALLMCIDSLGSLTCKWGGGMMLHVLHVTRTDFTNLWLAILIRNLLRFSTLALTFLIPKASQSEVIIPSDLLSRNSTSIDGEDENLERVPSQC